MNALRGKFTSPVPTGEEALLEEKFAEYQKVCKKIKSIHKKLQTYIDLTKKQIEIAAILGIEFSYFHLKTGVEKNAIAFGQLHAEIERIQLASVEKLYQSEVKQKTEDLILQYPKTLDKWKERKKLKAAYASQQKKFEDKQTQLHEFDPSVPPKKGMFGKKKNEEVLAEELNLRGQKLQEAKTKLENSTNYLKEFLSEFLGKKKDGSLLEVPVSAIVACQYHIIKESNRRMEKVKNLFPMSEAFSSLLESMDEESIDEIRNQEIADGKGAVFARRISSKTPPIVCDCMAYIRNGRMDIEGLFRIPGEASMVDKIKAEYDKGTKGALELFGDEINVHDVCGLLKLWFRATKEPLVPYEQYDQLLMIMRDSMMDIDSEETIQAAVAVVESMESPRKEVLGLLMQFLQEITRHKGQNSMTSSNLATCVAPAIARSDDSSPVSMLRDLHPVIASVTLLIENAERLTAPSAADVEKSTHIKVEKPKPPAVPPRDPATNLGPPPGIEEPTMEESQIDMDL